MRIDGRIAAAAALALFGAGAAATYIVTGRSTAAPSAATGKTAASATAPSAPPSDVLTIPADVLARAGIKTEIVARGRGTSQLHVPGTVQPNAYRKVTVTPLVAGRVSRVLVELGQRVARGAPLAEVYAPELAEVRARYAAAVADLDAGEARLRRTERLAAIGSASQQELEAARAEHARHEVEAREAAARLRLLGIDPAHVTHPRGDDSAASVVRITAPQDGVIIERPVTAGMSVEPSTTMMTIADLTPVWVIADVYERDFSRVSVGSDAVVTTDAYPGLELKGRVTYIAPDVRAETRTTQVRVEVPNADGRLRFGMFVGVSLGAAYRSDTVTVPAAAVQTVGSTTVVFVPSGTDGESFRERRVTIGETSGDRVEIVSGLEAGERVVTEGSFALRAEAERQGTTPSDMPRAITVRITTAGFEPNSIDVKPGVPLRMTFIRTTDETCAKDVVLVDYGIRRELPLGTPVTVEFTPRKSFVFQCGMNMLSGTLTVR